MREHTHATYILSVLGLLVMLAEESLVCLSAQWRAGLFAFGVVCLCGALWNGVLSLRER